MRPWRKLTYYGFWVMGVAALLSLLTALALEPFAHARGWWVGETPRGVWAWHTAPWVDFLGWLLTTLAIYGFTTPWLLNKQPVKQPTRPECRATQGPTLSRPKPNPVSCHVPTTDVRGGRVA